MSLILRCFLCFLCLIGLEIFVLSTFAKNDPLTIKTSGVYYLAGGTVFFIRGKGLYTYTHLISMSISVSMCTEPAAEVTGFFH